MPVCGNYLFFELPKKIVLNPKDGLRKVLLAGFRKHRKRYYLHNKKNSQFFDFFTPFTKSLRFYTFQYAKFHV